jgi:hypothetical protein
MNDRWTLDETTLPELYILRIARPRSPNPGFSSLPWDLIIEGPESCSSQFASISRVIDWMTTSGLVSESIGCEILKPYSAGWSMTIKFVDGRMVHPARH